MANEVTLSQEEIFIGGQLLDVKLKCLELAMQMSGSMPDPDNTVEAARKFFDFILEETE